MATRSPRVADSGAALQAQLDTHDWLAWAKARNFKREGSQWEGPCPACGGENRFRVNRQGRVFCRQCCPDGRNSDALRRITEAAGFTWRNSEREEPRQPGPAHSQRANRTTRPPRSAPARRNTPSSAKTEGNSLATRVWAATQPDPGSVAACLARRGAWPPGRPLPRAVRWLSRAVLEQHRFRDFPDDAAGAVAYAFASATTGDLVALQMDAMTGAGAYPASRWRRTCGSPKGAVFPSVDARDDFGGDLHIAEGPVDALAITAWRGRPAWAAGGTSGLAALAPALAATGRQAVIEADGDGPGRQAAEALQDALHRAGAVARLHYWPSCDPAEGLAAEWAERAAILEYDHHSPRAEAEVFAWKQAGR